MSSLKVYYLLRSTTPHHVQSAMTVTRPRFVARVASAAEATSLTRSWPGGSCHRHQLQVQRRLCSASASSPRTSEQSPALQQDNGQVTAIDKHGSSAEGSKRGVVKLWKNPTRILWPFRSSNDQLRLTAPPLPAPSRLGESLVHLSDSLSRVLRGLSPWRLFRRTKNEDDDENHYRLKLDVPGLGKEDVKVTVEDGILIVRGERRQDEYWSDEEDGEWWYGGSYGRYDASLVLPEDAKVDGIKAEVRNGVLYVTMPREGDKRAKDVKEVDVT